MRLPPVIALLLLSIWLFHCKNSENPDVREEALSSDSLVTKPLDSLDSVKSGIEISKSKGFIKRYKGQIGEKNDISLSLIYWGDGTFSGYYSYDKVGKEIELFGELLNDSLFLLKEFVGEENTGEFKATFADHNQISGEWNSFNDKKTLSFQLKEVPRVVSNTLWTGTWFMNGIWDGGTLIIGNETEDHFTFALSFTRLGHIGSIEGKAMKTANTASYEQLEFYDEEEPCKLRFKLHENYIDLSQESSNIACGFGFRAFAGGRYEQELKNLKAQLSYGDAEAIFPNKKTHEAFLTMVGQKYYDIFAFNMQGYDWYEKDIKDQFEAQVVAGAVAGLYGANEAIIMYDKSQTFWAATLVYQEGDDLPQVHYYTNSKRHKSALPFTIENWKNSFSDYPVKIHYKERK